MHRDGFTRLHRVGPPSDHHSENELMVYSSTAGRAGQVDHEDNAHEFAWREEVLHWGANYDTDGGDPNDGIQLYLDGDSEWLNFVVGSGDVPLSGFFTLEVNGRTRFNIYEDIFEMYTAGWYVDASHDGYGNSFIGLGDPGGVQYGAEGGNHEFTADLGYGILFRSRYATTEVDWFSVTDEHFRAWIYDAGTANVIGLTAYKNPVTGDLSDKAYLNLSGQKATLEASHLLYAGHFSNAYTVAGIIGSSGVPYVDLRAEGPTGAEISLWSDDIFTLFGNTIDMRVMVSAGYLMVRDASNNPIMKLDENGQLHLKSGMTIAYDL